MVSKSKKMETGGSTWFWSLRKTCSFCIASGGQAIMTILNIKSNRVTQFSWSQSPVIWGTLWGLSYLPCGIQGTWDQSAPFKKQPSYRASCCVCYEVSLLGWRKLMVWVKGWPLNTQCLCPELHYVSYVSGLLGHLCTFWTASPGKNSTSSPR